MLSDRDRAIAAVGQAGVKLVMGHMHWFDVGYVEARRVIEVEPIERCLVACVVGRDVGPPPASLADPAVGGGLILDGMYADCILRDTEPLVSGYDSRATVTRWIAATQSMGAGRPIDVAQTHKHYGGKICLIKS